LPEEISAALAQGLSVVQADLDEGLAGYPDGAFDYVILSQTLQVVRNPSLVLREMLRHPTRRRDPDPEVGQREPTRDRGERRQEHPGAERLGSQPAEDEREGDEHHHHGPRVRGPRGERAQQDAGAGMRSRQHTLIMRHRAARAEAVRRAPYGGHVSSHCLLFLGCYAAYTTYLIADAQQHDALPALQARHPIVTISGNMCVAAPSLPQNRTMAPTAM